MTAAHERGDIDVTVVVPVRNAAPYLPTCLRSIRNQTHVGVQVVVVDDGSSDGSDEAAESMLEDVPGAQVLRSASSEGPGAARNRGLAVATGRWTLFVDSDDFLVPNVLADLVEIADRAEVDFAMFDYSRAMPSGESIRNARAASIAAVAGRVVRADDALDLFEILPVVWNKLFRTSWLRHVDMTFPPGIYEDMLVTYRALVEARRFVAVDRSCYYYRQRPESDSALACIDRRHFDLLDQWDRVFEATRTASGLLRRVLYDRMLDHAVYTLEQRIRHLSDDDFDEYFAGLARRFEVLRPMGLRDRDLKIGSVRSWAIRTGRPDVYRQVVMIGEAKRQLRSMRVDWLQPERIRGGARRRAESLDYRRQVRSSSVASDLAVFMSSWNRYPSGNPRAISGELARRRPEIRQVWIVDERHGIHEAIGEGFDVVPAGSRAHHDAMARARWLVSDVNFPDYADKRAGQIHLQTKHGTPLKTMGFDLLAFPQSAHGMDFDRLRARAARWDFIISSNPYSTEIWRRSFPLGYGMLEVGYPRNDRLATATAEDRDDARRSLGIEDEVVVLYAPTLRDYVSDAPLRVAPRRLVDDVGRMTGRQVVLLVRGHYLQDGPGATLTSTPPHSVGARVVDVTRHRELETLMLAADALVTDYSSVMFDFALLDRPIVLYLDDWEEYQRSRGTYVDIRAQAPGEVVTTQDELAQSLVRAVANSGPTQRHLEFRRRYCPWDDGRASARVVAAVFD